MKLKFVLLIIFLIHFISVAEATTFYNITLSGSGVRLNTTLILESEEPINVWQIVWALPKNSQVVSVSDEIGEIKDYVVFDNELRFETHSKRSNVRFAYIDIIIRNIVNDTFDPVYFVDLSLSGLTGTKTVVKAHMPNIISGHSSFGFTEFYDENLAKFEGVGPVSFKVYYGDGGEEYDNFIVFGDYNATIADQLYSIVSNVTGTKIPFEKFPLIILPDEKFNEKVNDWAAGTHVSGGLILIRESAANRDNNVSIILHEVTHGYNSKILSWDQTEIGWFDEGMGKLIEYIVSDALNLPQPSLFGDEVVISRGDKKYILLPKGDMNQLWNYYQNDLDFMESWNSRSSVNREFGYAFSELVIRDYVEMYDIVTLRTVYQKLANVNHTVTDVAEYNSIVLTAMDYSFGPCFADNYDILVECIQSINEYRIEVPLFSEEFIKSKIGTSETFLNETLIALEEIKEESILERIVNNLRNLILSIFQKINDLFS